MPPLSDNSSITTRFLWHARHLSRAGWIAIGWPQLGISMVAVVVYWTGMTLLFQVFGDYQPGRYVPHLAEIHAIRLSDERPPAATIKPIWTLNSGIGPMSTLVSPWVSIVAPLQDIVIGEPRIQFGPLRTPSSFLTKLIQLAWAIICWSLFGTAICRSVAVLVAKDRSESFREAVQFAWPRWPQTIGAPSIPAGAMLAIGIGLMIAAWFGRLPWIGTPLMALASPLLLIAGLIIAFLAFVILFGWPLMVAAMGVEDCDGFGALSRAYSFLAGRPLQAAINVVVSAVIGGVLVALVGGWFTFGLLAEANFLHGSIGTPERWLTTMQWSHFFAQGLLLSFAASLFWTLATLNFLLLRYEVDGKPLEDIAPGVSESSSPRDLPVVGIPATDYRPAQTDGQPVAVAD